MVRVFYSEDINFKRDFSEFLSLRSSRSDKLVSQVSKILSSVRKDRDIALIDYTKKFDDFDLVESGFSFSTNEIEGSENLISKDEKLAIEMAADRIRFFHEQQMPRNTSWTDTIGVELGWSWRPIEKVGVYVPGGRASYPSSAVMNIIPAKVAGVKDLILCTPTPSGHYNPMVLYAAKMLGVRKIFRIGGAQAIAALAIGTDNIMKVDKVTGPGNSYVSEAKRQLVGEIGIDALAGPSEVVIISDDTLSPKLAAIDLLAQAEHDEKAQSVLITSDREYAAEVEKEVFGFLQNLKRREIASKSWKNYGAIVIVDSLKEGINLSNKIAPEHLQLCFRDADKYLNHVQNAGSIFVGLWSPEAVGDYISGSNHVLPTNGSAKFSSSLSVFDFMKRTSITKLDRKSFKVLGPATITLANSEGLEAHSLSISERLKIMDE